MNNHDFRPVSRKIVRRRKVAQQIDARHLSLIELMLARLPIVPKDALGAVVDGVIAQWAAQSDCGQVSYELPATVRVALVELITGASIRADGQHFSREGIDHFKGSCVLQGWFMQHMHMPGGQSDCIRALAAVEGVKL